MPGECAMSSTTNCQKDAAHRLLIVASHDRNQHLHTRIKPYTGWSLSLCRCACSRVPTYTPPRRLRAPLCTGFTLAGEHRWAACAGWDQNATRAHSGIPSHSDADGATLNQDWESAGLQLIYATVYASLLAFRSHNSFSADGLQQR